MNQCSKTPECQCDTPEFPRHQVIVIICDSKCSSHKQNYRKQIGHPAEQSEKKLTDNSSYFSTDIKIADHQQYGNSQCDQDRDLYNQLPVIRLFLALFSGRCFFTGCFPSGSTLFFRVPVDGIDVISSPYLICSTQNNRRSQESP